MNAVLDLIKNTTVESVYEKRFVFTEDDLNLLDLEIGQPDEKLMKKASKLILDEVLDKTRILDFKNKDNKPYVYIWTNRVALYEFFEAFSAVLKDLGINENPFAKYKHARGLVCKAWTPSIVNTVKIFVQINPELQMDDAVSQSYIAFRNALLKRAMFVIGSHYKSQTCGFDKTLKFAVRREMQELVKVSTLALCIPVADALARSDARKT